MIEKKTTQEIFNLYPKICYAGVDYEGNNTKDFIACEELKVKEWVSVESLKEAISNLLDKTNDLHDLKCGSCDDAWEEFIKQVVESELNND